MKCDFFENVLSRAWAIHAAGDKWAGRGGPALPFEAGRVPPPGEPVKGERTVETRGDAPHSGVREALLAPMVAPALPDVGRSSSVLEQWKNTDPCAYLKFWWARRPPSLSYA